jgi:hypothetical protein
MRSQGQSLVVVIEHMPRIFKTSVLESRVHDPRELRVTEPVSEPIRFLCKDVDGDNEVLNHLARLVKRDEDMFVIALSLRL